MRPDPSDVDNAILAKLGSDAELLALCPNGVYWQQAPGNMRRFVNVSIVEHYVEPILNEATAFEETLYRVEARMLSTAAGDAKAAAARIRELLDWSTLSIPGYSLMAMYLERHHRPPDEVDAIDQSIQWTKRGGEYRVVVSPLEPGRSGT